MPTAPGPRLRRRPDASAPPLERERRRRQFGRAALTGVLAGTVAILFKYAVSSVQGVGESLAVAGRAHGPAGILALLAATAGLGAAVAWLTGRFAPEAGGSGIPHVKAVLLNARVIRPVRLLLVKFGCGLGALAAGMSLGREGPTIQMGAALGKLVGDTLRIRRRSYPALVASGAGAGLAAAFNAPLAGFIFVMEELKREMSALTYGTALVGSVCAVAMSRFLEGQGPSFVLPSAGPVPLAFLPLVAVIGALAGLAGVVFNKLLVGAIAAREALRAPRWAAGAAVGVLSGLALVYVPEITGSGHGVAERLLTGHFAARHLAAAALVVCAGKLLLTVASYATGVPGGIFAPLLVIGSFLGFALGTLASTLYPGLGVAPEVFATIGMASTLAGSVRAPLTGVVLIVEMTSEYGLLYALLVGAFAAYLVAEVVRDKPIYERLLERDLAAGSGLVHPEAEPTVIEVLVEPHSRLDGRPVRDLPRIEGALIASVGRGTRLIVPRGDTLLLAGDVLSIILEAQAPRGATRHFQEAARAAE